MARIRTIKPEFWQDEHMAECSEPARLLAIGVLNQSDDEGYFKAHPSLLKAAVFPFSEPSVSIHEQLTELSNVGYLLLCTGSDGRNYGKVKNFDKHQKINRATPSKIKELCSFSESSVSPHGALTPGKEQGTGKGTGNSSDASVATTTAKPKKKKRGSKIAPDDWKPKPETVAKMAKECPGVDLGSALAQLRDHEFPRAYTDWERVYCNWIRKSAQFSRPTAKPDQQTVRIPSPVRQDEGPW